MKKEPKPIKSICIATIKRKGGDRSNWRFSKLFDDLTKSEQMNYSNIDFERHELPIFIWWQNAGNWTLVTTHCLRGCIDNEEIKIALDNIDTYDYGIFKSPGGNLIIKEITIRTKDSHEFRMIQESQEAGLAMMYAVDYVKEQRQ